MNLTISLSYILKLVLTVCIFLSLAMMTNGFDLPERNAPLDLITNLIHMTSSKTRADLRMASRQDREPYVFDASPDPSSVEEDDEDDEMTPPIKRTCAADMNPNRTMTYAGDYLGYMNDSLYIDHNYGLFKFGLGWKTEDIVHSKVHAASYMKKRFGIEIDLTKFNNYMNPTNDMVFAPIVFNITLRIVADSKFRKQCADKMALMGGWMLVANNVTVKGDFGGEKGKYYEGKTSFLNLFIITAPGSRSSTRVEFLSGLPLNCGKDGGCVLTGESYNYEDESMGWIDGTIVTHGSGAQFQKVIRLVYMTPGRFFDMDGDNMGMMM